WRHRRHRHLCRSDRAPADPAARMVPVVARRQRVADRVSSPSQERPVSALLALLATTAGKYAAGAIGAAVLLLAAWLRGRRAGRAREQDKQASAEADALKTKKDVDHEID